MDTFNETGLFEEIIYFVFPCSEKKRNKFLVCPIGEHATFNWPSEKHGFSRFHPHTWSDWPCALLMVTENALVEIMGGNTSCHFDFPRRIVTSMTFGIRFLVRKRIIATSTLSDNLCGGMRGRSNRFKSSIR